MSFTKLKVGPIASELENKMKKLDLTKRPKKFAFVKVGEKKWYLPYQIVKNIDEINNFKVHSDDTWIITYPRSGKSFFI